MINYIEKYKIHRALGEVGLYIEERFNENGVGEWISEQNHDLINQFIIDYDPTPVLRAELKAQLVIDSQKFVDEAILKLYPKFEVDTWQNQLRDANAYIADNNAITPTLDALAAQRQITKLSLANKIIAKSAVFEAFSSAQAGERQRLEDLIDEAETVEELNAVSKFVGVI